MISQRRVPGPRAGMQFLPWKIYFPIFCSSPPEGEKRETVVLARLPRADGRTMRPSARSAVRRAECRGDCMVLQLTAISMLPVSNYSVEKFRTELDAGNPKGSSRCRKVGSDERTGRAN